MPKKSVLDELQDGDFLINKTTSERFDTLKKLEGQLFIDKDQILKIRKIVNGLLDEIKYIGEQLTPIDDDLYKTYHDKLVIQLIQLADISVPNARIKDILTEEYELIYARTPEIGKRILAEILYPYFNDVDRLKNRAHNAIELLEEHYIRMNKKFPPNV